MPDGTSPSTTNPCSGGNNGSGDLVCKDYTFGNDVVKTYVIANPSNPTTITIPSGEDYSGLYAIQNSYQIYALATRADGSAGTILGLDMKSRTVPIYQFAVFADLDTSLHPNLMDVGGPVHINGDFYVDATDYLNIYGVVSVTGQIIHGRNTNACSNGDVRMPHMVPTMPFSSSMLTDLAGSSYGCNGSSARDLGSQDFAAWNGMVKQGVDPLQVPQLSDLNPVYGSNFWDAADLRLVLKVDASDQIASTASPLTGIEVRYPNNTVNVVLTNTINNTCTNGSGVARFNNRPVAITSRNTTHKVRSPIENDYITMLEVDMRSLFDCLHNNALISLDDDTSGGLVIYMTVEGPDSATLNTYGVRLFNGANLSSTISGSPAIEGLTVVTNQALYVQGDYNTINKKSAALISDSINVFSNNWDDANSTCSTFPSCTPPAYTARVASNTTINAAIVSGSVISDGIHNVTRLHENWYSSPRKSLTITGSFISTSAPTKTNNLMINAPAVDATYSPPNRYFNFDTTFNNPNTLPPAAARFTYLKQTLFSRDFEQ